MPCESKNRASVTTSGSRAAVSNIWPCPWRSASGIPFAFASPSIFNAPASGWLTSNVVPRVLTIAGTACSIRWTTDAGASDNAARSLTAADNSIRRTAVLPSSVSPPPGVESFPNSSGVMTPCWTSWRVNALPLAPSK